MIIIVKMNELLEIYQRMNYLEKNLKVRIISDETNGNEDRSVSFFAWITLVCKLIIR